ncbi:hypothetical protein AB4344_22190, partial [Vibrio breoganii]
FNNRHIEQGEMQQIDENTIRMDITYNDGQKSVLLGVRDGDKVSYYMDGALVSETSIQALEQLAAEKA